MARRTICDPGYHDSWYCFYHENNHGFSWPSGTPQGHPGGGRPPGGRAPRSHLRCRPDRDRAHRLRGAHQAASWLQCGGADRANRDPPRGYCEEDPRAPQVPAETQVRITALDTSAIIAALLTWHESHELALEALVGSMAARGSRLVVPGPALVEAYAVMTRLPAPRRLPPARPGQ